MKQHKILVIDDEKELCSLLKSYFEDEGYAVHCSYDGEEGLKQVKSFDPSIILLDIRMPGMSGLEVLKKIKELTSAPVLCVSAMVDNEMVAECLKNGAFAYIFKPVDLKGLNESIQTALKEQP